MRTAERRRIDGGGRAGKEHDWEGSVSTRRRLVFLPRGLGFYVARQKATHGRDRREEHI